MIMESAIEIPFGENSIVNFSEISYLTCILATMYLSKEESAFPISKNAGT